VTAFRRIIPRLLPTLAIALPFVLCAQAALSESRKAAETAGATLFRDKGCAYCHGANAQGTPKGPSLENVRKTMKPAQISGQIKNGGQKMPSFDDSLTSDEITRLVAYLRAKHRPAPLPLPQPLVAPPNQN